MGQFRTRAQSAEFFGHFVAETGPVPVGPSGTKIKGPDLRLQANMY